jgi:hypothetical protein
LYQHNYTLGLAHCNSNLLAVAQQYVCDAVRYPQKIDTDYTGQQNLTLSVLMSYIYGAPCKARNLNVVYIYGPTFGNAESRLFLFAAQCFNIESMQKVILCHSCV